LADQKNFWIIPPSGENAIVVEGAEAGKKVTPESEEKIQMSAAEFQALGLGPDAKCSSVYKCTSVGPFNCHTVTISACFVLVDCTGVTCSALATKI
jgi:hypothetical protein